MQLSATTYEQSTEVRVDFEPGQERDAAASVRMFLEALAVDPRQPPADWSEPVRVPASIEVTDEQKTASGTPRKTRARKPSDSTLAPLDPAEVDHDAEMAIIQNMDVSPIIGGVEAEGKFVTSLEVTPIIGGGAEATVTWNDGSQSAAEVVGEEPGDRLAINYVDTDGKGSGSAIVPADMVSTAPAAEPAETTETIAEAAQKVYAARGYDIAGKTIEPGTLAADVLETPSAPPAAVTINKDQQAAVQELFDAAGMSPFKVHAFLTTEYPGVPVTIDTLSPEQYLGLVPILHGKVRDRKPEAPVFDDAPPPEAPVMDAPEEADPPASPAEADAVRRKAAELKVAPADARRVLLDAFGVTSPEALTGTQAKRAVDELLPAEAAAGDEIPF